MKLYCFILLCAACFADGIEGFYKTIDEKTGRPGCLVAIYEYQDRYYGRIIATYDKQGNLSETIQNPEDRAPGIIGQPFYCGLDLLWGLNKSDERYKGKIVDPKKGSIYRAEIWKEDDNLIVRGKLLCFGRNQTWLPAEEEDFSDFEKPDVTKFVPVIPEVD